MPPKRIDKKSLFKQEAYGNHGLCVKLNATVPPIGGKALVTLKGVLADVDPTFNRDDYMIWAAMTTFLDDVVRLRLLKLLIKDAWTLYRHSLSVMFDLQKVIGWFLLDVGRLWRKLPKQ